ncbi:PREDICTED: protein LOW PSII ACCUMULATION 2, chloroplastic [Ipomoea nil]|uniref:protein LOW PSII ACCUMULATION 2, chloroplastic n=1 Tax=Ipomoea nil TaxID=35883 RepID=UPI00090088B1|nr:PREDICTED: protein LOW PSII ACCUMULATION 2, chloroplastic [Ipomoea nil]
MALILHPSSSSCITKKNKYHPQHLHLLHRARPTHFSIKSQESSSTDGVSSSTAGPQPKNPDSAGMGFGSSTSTQPSSAPVTSKKKKQKGKGERASVIRRAPIQKPDFASQQDAVKAEEVMRNESAFLLAWLGLGGIILVEGIVLASSGFLPEQWDNFFVKYLYPSFTPTVGLFVAGTVAYGVLKYLENEKFRNEK